jgi:purine-binding chemotaxis protein CheW
MGTRSWLVFQLREELFGVPAERVREIQHLDAYTPVPQSEGWMRGVMNVRGRILPVVDLRQRLGWTSALKETEDLKETLKARWRDHVRWVTTLKEALAGNGAFTLPLDPTQCAFGRWYGHFQSEVLPILLAHRRIDSPHRALHREGAAALAARAEGNREPIEQALERIESAILPNLQRRFEEFSEALCTDRREVAVLVAGDGAEFAFCADAVVAVEPLVEESFQPISEMNVSMGGSLLEATAQRNNRKEVVQIIAGEGLRSILSRGPEV